MNRLAALRRAAAAADAADNPSEAVIEALLRPPLYNMAPDGTLYTAAYHPVEGRVAYVWPTERWEQSFSRFTPGTRSVQAGLTAKAR